MGVAMAREAEARWDDAALRSALAGAPITAPSPGADALLARVVADLDRRIDTLADSVGLRVKVEVPEYLAMADRGGALDVAASVRRIARVGLRVLAGGVVSQEELTLLRAIGAARAGQGLSLDGVLSGLRLAVWLGWNEILAEVRKLPLADATIAVLGTLAMRLFGFADQAAAAMAAGHLENRGRSRRGQERAELVEQLLDGAFESDDEMVRRAAGFGHDLTLAHGLLLLTGGERPALRSAGLALRRAIPGSIAAGHRGGHAGHVPVLVPCVDADGWAGAVEAATVVVAECAVTVVAVPPACRPGRIAAAYREAAQSAALAAGVFRRARLVQSEDLLAYRALRCPGEDRRRFIQRTLGELLALPPRHADPLLDTMETLFDQGGNVEATRRALGVHDKTIRYRIRRIREVTRLCPLRDRGRLELALMLHRLGAVES